MTTEEFYDALRVLTASTEWKVLCEEFSIQATALNDISSVQDSETLHHRKGQLQVINYLLNLEGIIDHETKSRDL